MVLSPPAEAGQAGALLAAEHGHGDASAEGDRGYHTPVMPVADQPHRKPVATAAATIPPGSG